MIKKFIILLIFYFVSHASFANELKIIYKINDEIITNFDVNKEIQFMKLNSDITKINKQKLISIAEQSLIREKIKMNEIEKIYDISYEKEINSDQINSLIDNYRINLGFNSNQDFKNRLNNINIKLEELKKKFVVEKFWNQIIFQKYNNLVNIDKKKINFKVQKLIEENSKINNFLLSEIVFIEKNKDDIQKKLDEIYLSIDKIGFKETAILFSISETGKLGGSIGWVNENQMSDLILKSINNLMIGEISKPIQTAGGTIILKLDNKEIVQGKIDKEREIKKIFISERDRILNQYSILYFKELENKAYVEKL